jgi:uncharacterized protein (DUF58 family)
MDTKEILKKVRKIEIKTRRLSDHIFSGEYHSSFKGRGMTFSEVRNYQYGDDIRSIDWNVTARYNEPFVKVFEEERELTFMLAVDVSASEAFGTTTGFKRDTLTEIAATLAFSAIQNNDKVGLMLFSDDVELFIPPKKGKSHVLRIIRELIEFKPKSKKTDIDSALKDLSNRIKKKAIVFVLSDFMDQGYEQTLKILGRKHDLTGIRIYDRMDEELPDVGLVPMKDAESGEVRLVQTSSKSVRTAYKAAALRRKAHFENAFARAGAGSFSTAVEESYVKKLLMYFKARSA